MVLIFSMPFLLGQFVERRENPVEHGEHLLRRQAFGNRVKLTMSTNITVTSAKPSAMVWNYRVSAVRRWAGQDVEQQLFGTLLLDPAAGGGFPPGWPAALVLFLRRVAQQQIDDASRWREVERKEENAGANRDRALLKQQRHRPGKNRRTRTTRSGRCRRRTRRSTRARRRTAWRRSVPAAPTG
jgi:hypothetical protein